MGIARLARGRYSTIVLVYTRHMISSYHMIQFVQVSLTQNMRFSESCDSIIVLSCVPLICT